MLEPDLVLEFEIEKGRSPDIESVAKALMAWNDAVQAACSAISPNARIVVELVGVEHGSQRFKQVFRLLEDAAESIDEGGTEYPLIWKHTKSLAKCIAGAILVAVVANQVTSNPGLPDEQMQVFEDIRDLLQKDWDFNQRGQDFYGILQDEPAFKVVEVYEGNNTEPTYIVPRSEFAFKSGLFDSGLDTPEVEQEDRVGTLDVVLIKPVLVAKPRRWTFARDGSEFSAEMNDKAVLEAIQNKTLKIPFAEGVTMKIEVAYKERKSGDTWIPVKGTMKVTKVLSPRVTLPPPGTLFAEAD